MSRAGKLELGEGMDVRIDGELFHIVEAGNGLIHYEVDHSGNTFTETTEMFTERMTQGDLWKVYKNGVASPDENYVAGRRDKVIQ